MRGIKFESFAKLFSNSKTLIHKWIYLFAINILFLYKKGRILDHGTPKPELYVALDGWWNIIHMYESMY